jgi:hypothetical protein
LDLLAHKVYRETLDYREVLDQLEPRVLLEIRDPRVRKEFRVQQELLVLPEPKGLKA